MSDVWNRLFTRDRREAIRIGGNVEVVCIADNLYRIMVARRPILIDGDFWVNTQMSILALGLHPGHSQALLSRMSAELLTDQIRNAFSLFEPRVFEFSHIVRKDEESNGDLYYIELKFGFRLIKGRAYLIGRYDSIDGFFVDTEEVDFEHD